MDCYKEGGEGMGPSRSIIYNSVVYWVPPSAVFSLSMQIKACGSPLKQELDSTKDSIAINNHVVSNVNAV